MGFLRPGERYEITTSLGAVGCKSLSFQQQREVMRLVKKLQTNNDPEEAMDTIESIIGYAAIDCVAIPEFSVSALLGLVSFPEAMDICKQITESGKLSEVERKKSE